MEKIRNSGVGEITDVWIDEAQFIGQAMRPMRPENERNLPSYYLEWLDRERAAGRNPAVGSIPFNGIA